MDINVALLAKLSKLSPTTEEAARLESQLSSILDYVAQLQQVDTSNVEANAYITDAKNVFRDDVVLTNEEEAAAVRADFPKAVGRLLEVPAIFEKGV